METNETFAPLEGAPSIAYGLVRSLAFQERVRTSRSQLRVLFGEAGRRSVPWGCLWYELNGNIYQFGSGVDKLPGTRGPNGKGVNAYGLKMMGEGLPASMTVGDGDFKWVQGEVDLSKLVSPEGIDSIQQKISDIRDGSLKGQIYQSRMRARALGLPIREDSDNCTSFIGRQIADQLKLDLPEYMPLDLFSRLQELDAPQDELDRELEQVLSVPEEELMLQFEELLAGQTLWKGVTGFTASLPKSLTWKGLSDKIKNLT